MVIKGYWRESRPKIWQFKDDNEYEKAFFDWVQKIGEESEMKKDSEIGRYNK